jgi:hypothetical protein
MLKRICTPRKEEVTGQSRKLHDEELHNLCPSPRMVKKRRIRWAECIARKGEEGECFRIFVGKRQL